MIQRIAALALVAALAVIGGAVSAWSSHVASIRSSMQSRGTIASTLLDAGARDARAVLESIRTPGLRTIVEDHDAGTVFESTGATIQTHDAGGPRPPQPAPFERFIAESIRIAPLRLEGESLAVVVVPDLPALRSWLIGDAALSIVVLAAIAGLALAAGARSASRARSRLEAVIEERRVAAAEFQRFLADAGHELRTPLTIVSGYADILNARLADSGDRDTERILSGMKAETARMRALVEKMLLLAKLDTPVGVPRLIDARTIAGEAVRAMQERYPGREVVLHGDGPAPLVIDQDDLYEALRNLLENALKYAPQSAVCVQMTTCEGRVELCVTDTGPGIAQSERERVFERFYRGQDRADAEGSGLGLAIVKRVADRWNGAVNLESRPGMTAFTLQFPLAAVEAQ